MKRVGIDIGGTNLRCAIFDEKHNLIEKFKCPNNKELTVEQNLDQLIQFIKEYDDIERIGIGCPGPLDAKKGIVLNPPNLYGWDNFEIVKYFEKQTGIPTKMTNDVNVAGLAEALLGAGRDYESVYFVTMSTGVGGAYVFRKELINGASTCCGEIYNMIVNDDTYCHRGCNPGSLNEQCGGPALERIASEAYVEKVTTKKLFDKFYAGDPKAVAIIEKSADLMGRGIANICTVIDPEVYIIGGSIARLNPQYTEMCIKAAKKYYIKPEYLKWEYAKFGDDAGLIGASLL